jgi:hypothetical protein
MAKYPTVRLPWVTFACIISPSLHHSSPYFWVITHTFSVYISFSLRCPSHGHNNQPLVIALVNIYHTLWIPKEISKTIQECMWKQENLQFDRIGKGKTIELRCYAFIQRQPKIMTPSPQVCPLSSFLLKCLHSPVMYITIYPFAIALLNHTLLTTASAFLCSKHLKAL